MQCSAVQHSNERDLVHSAEEEKKKQMDGGLVRRRRLVGVVTWHASEPLYLKQAAVKNIRGVVTVGYSHNAERDGV